MAVAGFPLRRKKAGVRGRERLSHPHGAPESSGSERKEGLRQGAAQPGQEHHPHRCDRPRRSHGGVGGPIEGATDALAFEAYVERFLAPSLREGQVGWCSMGSGRTGQREGQGARASQRSRPRVLAFILSPDLNPIEEAFSKIKQLVRKAAGARTREALVEAIGRALAAVTPEDAAGWFAHAGYWPQDQPL